jgi:Fic family protein
MKPDDFKSSTSGVVIVLPTGYHAFVPNRLPPSIAYDQDLAIQLSRADTALSELSGLGRILPNPRVLIRPLVQREAVLSSQIEGTQASLSELLFDEASPSPERHRNRDDLQEIQNYVTALEYGLKRLKEFPLALRLVRELHHELMAGVRGEDATPGEFRKKQNWIGPAGSNPMNAAYVPPPVDEMNDLLSDWEKFLNVRESMPDLIQCAILHEQFEAIHPFLDGNGRVGRLLISLFLVERGRLSLPLLYLSDFIEQHRSDYYDLLQRVRTHGEWMPWIRFFLAGVEATAKDASHLASRLIDLRESMVRDTNGALKLVDHLLANPYITIATAATVLEVTVPTATRRIREMEAKGILRETTGKMWRKVYVASGVLSILDQRVPR